MRKQTTTEHLRYDFSKEELAEKSLSLAQAYQRKTAAEEEKKAAVSQFAERVNQENALLGKLSREVNSGWETRPIECDVRYHSPNTGMKEYVRKDTGEVVKTLSMVPDEMQDPLFVPAQAVNEDESAENIAEHFGVAVDEVSDDDDDDEDEDEEDFGPSPSAIEANAVALAKEKLRLL